MGGIYANSQGQLLAAHSVLVGRLAQSLASQIYTGRDDTSALDANLIAKLARWAGMFHDIGKLDPHFQNYIQSLVQQQRIVIDAWSVEDGVQIPQDAATPGQKNNADHPRHQEVSWLLFRLFFESDGYRNAIGVQASNSIRFDYIEYAIYWHHAKPLRAEEERKHWTLADNIASALAERGWSLEQAKETLDRLLKQMRLWEPSLPSISDFAGRTSQITTPRFKLHYANSPAAIDAAIQHEAYKTAIRACVVSADRIVSKLTAQQLMEHLQCNTLPSWDSVLTNWQKPPQVYLEIASMVARYESDYQSTRTKAQSEAATQLAKQAASQGVAVLQGPAGSGKSKIFLQTLALAAVQQQGAAAKRIFVFVPRTAIGEGLFDELVNEYQVRTRVELLLGTAQRWSVGDGQVIDTPETQQGSGDLVITTVDQLCKTMLSHDRLDWVTELACNHVVFDEFHELFDIPGISLLFREVMRLRQLSQGVTLLVSATPNPYLLAQIAPKLKSAVAMPALHNHPYTLMQEQWSAQVHRGGEHTHSTPWMATTDFAPGAFVISNTALLAQACSVARHRAAEKVICFHSRYTASDKKNLLSLVMSTYGKKAAPGPRPILISGPIVQASLNISTSELHTEATTAENFLQRVGRCNRFGETTHAHIHYCRAVNEKTDALANAAILKSLYQAQRTTAFTAYFCKQIPSKTKVTLPQLYALYDTFHQTDAARSAYAADEQQVLADSRKLFEDDTFDPVRWPAALQVKGKAEKGSRLASRSLRSRSYFVLPVRLQFLQGKLTNMQLQWAPDLPPDQLMTDPLNFHKDLEKNVYLEWTQKPLAVLDTVRLKVPEQQLKKIGSQAKKHKGWESLRHKALQRDHPVVISSTAPEKDSFYYLQLDDLLIGLAHAKRISNASGWDFLLHF